MAGWFKVDELIDLNPKFIDLTGDAAWLYIRGLAQCSRQNTDGFIDRRALRVIGNHIGWDDARQPDELAKELTDVGLWVEVGNGWVIHDFHDWNRSAEERAHITEVRKRAGQRGGEASGRVRAKQSASKQMKPPEATPREATNPDTDTDTDTERVKTGADPRRESAPSPVDRAEVESDFAYLWESWPKRQGTKGSKKKAHIRFRNLTARQRRQAVDGASVYAAWCELTNTPPQDCITWLNQERFDEDWSEALIEARRSTNVRNMPRNFRDEQIRNAELAQWAAGGDA